MQKPLQIAILAAGKGTRMQSDLAKVLHPLLGKPMIYYVLRACLALAPKRIVVIVGHQAQKVEEQVRGLFPRECSAGTIEFALQDPPQGTGHAVWSGRAALTRDLPQTTQTLILNGDGPMITPSTLKAMMTTLNQAPANTPLILLSFHPENPFGYGRILRNSDGSVRAIIEEKEASSSEKQIRECNAGTYIGDTDNLFNQLEKIMMTNKPGEYYLTDIVEKTVESGFKVLPFIATDPIEALGINDIQALHDAEQLLKQRNLE